MISTVCASTPRRRRLSRPAASTARCVDRQRHRTNGEGAGGGGGRTRRGRGEEKEEEERGGTGRERQRAGEGSFFSIVFFSSLTSFSHLPTSPFIPLYRPSFFLLPCLSSLVFLCSVLSALRRLSFSFSCHTSSSFPFPLSFTLILALSLPSHFPSHLISSLPSSLPSHLGSHLLSPPLSPMVFPLLSPRPLGSVQLR